MNANVIIGITAALVGCVVGLVVFMQSQSDDGTYLTKSKWSLTLAEGNTAQTWLVDTEGAPSRFAPPMAREESASRSGPAT